MTFSQHVAGNTILFCLIWLIWAVGAPIVAGYPPLPEPQHICPSPTVKHGVGKDLKTYIVRIDRCASEQP